MVGAITRLQGSKALNLRQEITGVACAAAMGGLSLQGFAQTSPRVSDAGIAYKPGDPADWPKELDALTAAPDNHKVLLENKAVRVLEVTLAPDTIEPLHSHQWPSVLYFQSAGDFIDRDAEGETIMDSRTLSEPMTFPLTMWKGPEAPHAVENLSRTQSIRLIRVEIKPSQGSLARRRMKDADYKPSENEGQNSEESWENWRWEGKDE